MMKKLSPIFFCFLAVALLLYVNQGKTITVRSHSEDRAIDEDAMIAEIEVPLSDMVKGIVEWNAPLIFEMFSDSQDARYVRDGSIYKSIASAERSYAESFEGADLSVKRPFEFTRKEYDVINANTVLFTGIGELSIDARGGKPWVIAYTILWLREAEGWKAINMHTSWE